MGGNPFSFDRNLRGGNPLVLSKMLCTPTPNWFLTFRSISNSFTVREEILIGTPQRCLFVVQASVYRDVPYTRIPIPLCSLDKGVLVHLTILLPHMVVFTSLTVLNISTLP